MNFVGIASEGVCLYLIYAVPDIIKGDTGADGKSAYELAVENGFEGTLSEWLNSLKGEIGAQGLQGEKGDKGNSGKEIDLIIIENGTIYPVEIKKNADPGKDALKNFSVLQSLNMPIGEGAVVCMSSMTIPLDGKNRMIPVTCI